MTAPWFPADHRVPVLRRPAEQVGAADLPPRVHEEPPGLPPRAPRPRLALPHLHVHARGVSPCRRHGSADPGCPNQHVPWCLPPPPPVFPTQAGAAGVQRPPAADDRGAAGDGARHPAHQLPLPGRRPRRWASARAGPQCPRCPQCPRSRQGWGWGGVAEPPPTRRCAAGSLTVSITDMRAPLVGGSGGVYALCSAHLANVVMVSAGGGTGE